MRVKTEVQVMRRGGSLVGERRGAMLVFVAVAMVTLLGFLAMTLDVGAGHRERRIAQTAADAGALGGGNEIYRRLSGTALPDDSVRASALNEAVRNGFPADDVTVYYPPSVAAGAYSGDDRYVEVAISRNIRTLFGSLFGVNSLDVAARAVAGVSSYSLTCLYSLDPSAPDAISVKKDLNTNCGIAINSSNPNALSLGTSGTIDASGSSIAISGGWTGNKPPVPTPSTGTAAVPDPLAYLQMPTVGPCTYTGRLTIKKDTVLSPGVYCGGIDVSSKTVNLNPGTYILAGGGMTIANGGELIGPGVTFVNTFNASYAFAPLYFGNGCKASLSAPTSGYFKGILMYQDPAAPAGAINVFACSSDSGPELSGALYFPTQTISFQGSNSTTDILGTVIAKNIDVQGKVSITLDTSGNSVVKRLSLVQ